MTRSEPTLESASTIKNVPVGGISATDLQLAINEIDAEKVAISGAVITGNLSVSGTLTGTLVTPNISNPVNVTVQKNSTIRLIVGGTGGGSTFINIGTDSVLFPVQASSAPAYVKGGIYFDLTSGKLAIGGASAWEMINSNV